MIPSPTLAAHLDAIYDAVTRGDGEAIRRYCADDPGAVFIGTDPGEWFESRDDFAKMLEAQAGADVRVRHGRPLAFEEGSVGWVADQGAFVLPDGTEMPFRITAVFRRQDGEWLMVQEHASVAVPNQDTLGADLT